MTILINQIILSFALIKNEPEKVPTLTPIIIKFKVFYIQSLEFLINNKYTACILQWLSRLYAPKLNTSMKNIAFIMDGNRRYAKKKGLSDIGGKTIGFEKMLEISKYCRELGLTEVSFFAFSLNNFKRKQCEVSNVMDLIKIKKHKLQDINVKVNIIGRKDVLDNEIKSIFKEITDLCVNDEFVMNIFFAYSSLDEIKNVAYRKDVDLLIRTSGEKRLSDFMLYQCANGTKLFFCDSLWPSLSLLQLWLIIYKCEVERRYFGQ